MAARPCGYSNPGVPMRFSFPALLSRVRRRLVAVSVVTLLTAHFVADPLWKNALLLIGLILMAIGVWEKMRD